MSIGHPHALAIDLALIKEQQVIPDFRTPDNIRFGCTPLYTTFTELATAVERLLEVMRSRSYERYLDHVPTVT